LIDLVEDAQSLDYISSMEMPRGGLNVPSQEESGEGSERQGHDMINMGEEPGDWPVDEAEEHEDLSIGKPDTTSFLNGPD
jgi:hypothetical protein